MCFVTMLGAHGQEVQVIWRYGTTIDLQYFVDLPQSTNNSAS